MNTTYVIKRDGNHQEVHFDAILIRHKEIINDEPVLVDVNPVNTAKDIIQNIRPGISTSELDTMAAFDAESKKLDVLGNHKFAGRLYLSNLYKNSPSTFSESTRLIFKHQERQYYKKIVEILDLLSMLKMALHKNDKTELINKISSCVLFKFYKSKLVWRINNIIAMETYPTIPIVFLYKKLIGDIHILVDDMVNIDPIYYNWIMDNKDTLNNHVSIHGSYAKLKDQYAMFGIDTYDKIYFKHGKNGRLLDRIPYVLMRIAVHCHSPNMNKVIECFDLLNTRQINFATPMYIRACYVKAQTISCIKTIADDNIESIMKCVYNKSLLSKFGYGMSYIATPIRSAKSIIKSSGGESKGVHAQIMLDKYLTKCWDQGGSRAGAEVIDIDDYHADVPTLLVAKRKVSTLEPLDNLHLSLNLHQVFYDRMSKNEKWSFFSPDKAIGLNKVYGDDFTLLYKYYEDLGYSNAVKNARDVYNECVLTRINSGEPYIINIDQVNKKSNHINIGIVSGSNLCAEVMQVTLPDMYANCILGSINYNNPLYINWDAVNKYRVEDWGTGMSDVDAMKIAREIINYTPIVDASSVLTFSLNNSLERNYYPVPEAERGARLLRSLGIGAHGFANLLAKLRLPFTTENPITKYVNRFLAEAKYYGFIRATCDEVELNGKQSYHYFEGSPFSKGILQFHMWGVEPQLYSKEQWAAQIERVKRGTYNSQGTANMPTATMSQINDNIEAHESFSSNIFKRITKHGSWTIINFDMIDHLKSLGLWNGDTIHEIERNNGSIQDIKMIPNYVKNIYKTIYEIKQKQVMLMAADRGAYVDQSESTNLHFKASNISAPIDDQIQEISDNIVRATIFSNEIGLKTSCYYTRLDIPDNYRYRVNIYSKKECTPECESCSL